MLLRHQHHHRALDGRTPAIYNPGFLRTMVTLSRGEVPPGPMARTWTIVLLPCLTRSVVVQSLAVPPAVLNGSLPTFTSTRVALVELPLMVTFAVVTFTFAPPEMLTVGNSGGGGGGGGGV